MELEIDWEKIESQDSFYELFLSVISAPEWHGRNLDALSDSVVAGGVVKAGPPFCIKHLNCSKSHKSIREFQAAVISIFTESIIENGGKQVVQA